MEAGTESSVLVARVGEDSELLDAIDDETWTVRRTAGGEALLAELEAVKSGCVLLAEGTVEPIEDQLERVSERRPDLPVFAVVSDEERGLAALEAGATDFVLRRVATEHEAVLVARVEAARRGAGFGSWRDLDYYETLLEAIPDTIVVTDTDGVLVDTRGFEGWSGYTKDELVGEHVSKIVPEPAVERGNEVVRELLEDDTRRKATYETRIVTKDGEAMPFENNVTLLPPDDGGRVPGVMSVLRNVSDHKERQRELELKNRAMDEAPIGITIADATDPAVPIVYANDGFRDLTGYEQADVLGESWSVLRGEETDESAVAALEGGIENGEPVTEELLVYRKDATPFWTRASVAPLEDDDGVVTHVVGFQQDVTERKEYEQAIERRFDEFSRVLAEDLREPVDRAISELVAARETGDEGSLEGAVEWLRRADSMLEDISIVHSHTVPERDLSETALRGAGDEE